MLYKRRRFILNLMFLYSSIGGLSLANGQTVYDLTTNPTGQIFAATQQWGLVTSNDNGETWYSLNNGTPFSDSGTYSVFTPDEQTILVGGGYGIFRSPDLGSTWSLVGGSMVVWSIYEDQQHTLYAGQEFTGILRSLDGGETWDDFGFGGYVVNVICMDSNQVLYAGTDLSGLFRSTDGGSSWDTTAIHDAVYTLSVLSSTRLLAGTASGLCQSQDGGNTWQVWNFANQSVRALVRPTSSQWYAGVHTSLQLSTNGGRTWEEVRSFTDRVLSLIADTTGHIIVGTRSGLWVSTDAGDSWNRISNILVGISPSVSLPERFCLYPNYPNPFNPSTTIRYQLPENAHVTLTIYNQLGQMIRTLIDREDSPGDKSVVWDGMDDAGARVAAGIYLARLVSAANTSVIKMLYLK